MNLDSVCERCGETADKHALANFADGQQCSASTLIYPAALFKEYKSMLKLVGSKYPIEDTTDE